MYYVKCQYCGRVWYGVNEVQDVMFDHLNTSNCIRSDIVYGFMQNIIKPVPNTVECSKCKNGIFCREHKGIIKDKNGWTDGVWSN